MPFLTKYGQFQGIIPATFGRVFFVSATATYTVNGIVLEASDNNDGLSPERAKRTIQSAINDASASVGDVIALMPSGTAHTSASQVTISKAGLTFIGLNTHFRDFEAGKTWGLGSKVTWTSSFAGAGVALTAADCTFIGISMLPLTAQTFMTGTTCPRTSFYDCLIFLSAAVSTSTKGVVFSGGVSSGIHFKGCLFLNSVATSAQGPAIDMTGTTISMIEDCTFLLTGTSGAWAVAVQYGASASGIVRNSTITTINAGTITIGFDGTGVTIANSVHFNNNIAGVSPGVGAYKNFDADSATTANCITALVSGAGTTETSNHLVI